MCIRDSYGYMIDTSLEGRAEQMGVPADTLAETVEAFNAHTKACLLYTSRCV